MKWYKVYGTRQYSTYVEAACEWYAKKFAQKIPLKDWEPSAVEGQEIYPKEACKL